MKQRRLGAARARRRTLAPGSGPPLARCWHRFAILAALVSNADSRTRAAPRCLPSGTGWQPVLREAVEWPSTRRRCRLATCTRTTQSLMW